MVHKLVAGEEQGFIVQEGFLSHVKQILQLPVMPLTVRIPRHDVSRNVSRSLVHVLRAISAVVAIVRHSLCSFPEILVFVLIVEVVTDTGIWDPVDAVVLLSLCKIPWLLLSRSRIALFVFVEEVSFIFTPS